MTGHLFVIVYPCNCVFFSCHALLTENKDSVNGTGLGFMVWGEALKGHIQIREIGLAHKVVIGTKNVYIKILEQVVRRSMDVNVVQWIGYDSYYNFMYFCHRNS